MPVDDVGVADASARRSLLVSEAALAELTARAPARTPARDAEEEAA